MVKGNKSTKKKTQDSAGIPKAIHEDSTTQKQVTVSFPKEGKEISVPEGATVLDAAIAAGIFLNSVCGGMGRCGKCKIIPKGKFESDESELITASERKSGMALACKTRLLGDAEIQIPPSSKVSIHQILTKCEMVKVDKPEPLIRKYYLQLTEPTMDNNLSDFNRVKQSLIKAIDGSRFTSDNIISPISVLHQLPQILRANGWELTVTVAEFDNYLELVRLEAGDTTKHNYGLCIDIGTTTIVAELVDLNTGNSLGCSSNYNKQKVCGEDVLSRIMYAEEHGVSKLHELVIENVNYLISELRKETEERPFKIDKEEICYVVFAGNTTMTHMLLGLEPTYIRRDPYIPTVNLVPKLKAHELNLQINPEAIVYCLPSRASWVGGDITADILASDLHNQDELSLMLDVGTNGEVVLGNKNWLIGCSCSAGPAFEGGEVQFGMNASIGAIEKVKLSDELDVKYKTIGNAPPRGICGSGLIDLMAELFIHKVIDRNGHFKAIKSPRLITIDDETVFVVAFASETGFEHKQPIYVTETDIKNVLRTKAAVFAACYVLLKSLGYKFDDLAKMFIAGGFGNYLDTEKAIMLGLLPDIPLEKFKFIGNGSLAGSYLTLLSEKNKVEAEKIFEKLTYVELSVSNEFYNEFVSALFLPHTNLKLFPSVEKII